MASKPDDKKVQLTANYFRIISDPDWCLYRYRMKFEPQEDRYEHQKALIDHYRDILGSYLLDGAILYCAQQPPLEFPKNEKCQITADFLGDMKPRDPRYVQMYNLLAKRALETLDFRMVGRNFYDINTPEGKVNLDSYPLEVWTGYQTAVQEHEAGIMMSVDVSHKVMSQLSVFDILESLLDEAVPDYQEVFTAEVTGLQVWTEYDHKVHKVDGVDFSLSPISKVRAGEGQLELTYKEFYKIQYGINIYYGDQPLLVTHVRGRSRFEPRETIYLIPELCAIVGLTSGFKEDAIVKDLLSALTVVGPQRRMDMLQAFNNRLLSNPDLQGELHNLNMKLDSKLVEVCGKILPSEKLIFGDECHVDASIEGDWAQAFKEKNLYQNVKLDNWIVVTPQAYAFEAKNFVAQMMKSTRNFSLSEPRYVELEELTPECYSSNLQKSINQFDPQLLMIVVQGRRPEIFTRVMKKCYTENAVPCQVITDKCFTSDNQEEIATKVAIQLSCKIGGIPWSIHIPLSGLMFVGVSFCHDTEKPNITYAALVASLDKGLTRYFSTVSSHERNDQLTRNLISNLTKALEKFREANEGSLPSRIILYRDGAPDGQIGNITDHEVTRVEGALRRIYKDSQLSIAYVLVSIHSNTRLFNGHDNPPLGTIVEDTITHPVRKDFFLISQRMKNDTVMATYYHVISDSVRLSLERIQILTYKLTHVYFNCSNTVRGPALLQYAHKLAFLVAQSIHATPDPRLQDLLYFL